MTDRDSEGDIHFATVLVVQSWNPDEHNDTGLPIEENDIIDVEDTETIDSWRFDTWWYGTKVGTSMSGWFPSACTKIIQHKPPDSDGIDDPTTNVPTALDSTSSGNKIQGVNFVGTLRVVRDYVGPCHQHDGEFEVRAGELVSSVPEEEQSHDDDTKSVLCRSLRTHKKAWIPAAFLRQIRQSITASHDVRTPSVDEGNRGNTRVAAPDWVLRHSGEVNDDEHHPTQLPIIGAQSSSLKSPHTVATQVGTKFKKGRPEPIQVPSQTQFVDDSCSEDDHISDSHRSMQLLSPATSRSASPHNDGIIEAFRSGDTTHRHGTRQMGAPVVLAPRTIALPLKNSDNQGRSSNSSSSTRPASVSPSHRFRHETGETSSFVRDLQQSSPRSLPSSPKQRAVNVAPAILHGGQPLRVDSRAARAQGVKSSVATQAYSAMMAALLSPPSRSLSHRSPSRHLPSIGQSLDVAGARLDASSTFQLSERPAADSRNGTRSSRSHSLGSLKGTETKRIRGPGDSNFTTDTDTTYAWLLQQQEIARSNGTGVASDKELSQQVLKKFMDQQSPQSHSSSESRCDEQLERSTADNSATHNSVTIASNGMECIICCDNTIDTALYPCWHIICCSACAKRVEKCPQCRRKIKFRQKVYVR